MEPPDPSPPPVPAPPAAGGKRRRRRRLRVKPGATPGTLIVDPDAPHPALTVIAYGPEACHEAAIADPDEVRPLLERHPVVWLNVDGLGDAEVIRKVGRIFDLHRLELEDVLNVTQRPKCESYEGHRFLVARAVVTREPLVTEQIALFVGKRFLLTFQERHGDGFGPVRERIRAGTGLIRTMGPDYLAYALLDMAIDGYFPLLERVGEQLEEFETRILRDPRPECLPPVYDLKRDLLTIRRIVWAQREALSGLLREPDAFFQATTRPYLNDLYDHTVQILDVVETDRELCSGMVELYMTSQGHKLNEVMKVLTVIATIFIPLTFVAGIYGMNFEFMPELQWRWGYPLAIGAMTAIGLGLAWAFRRRGWI